MPASPESPENDVVEEAKELLSRTRQTLPRRLMVTIPKSVGWAFVVVAVPYMVESLTRYQLVWPILVLALSTMVITASGQSLRERARHGWARQIVDQSERFAEIKCRFEQIQVDYKTGNMKLEALQAASARMSTALRPLVSSVSISSTTAQGDLLIADFRISLKDLKKVLRLLCQSVQEALAPSSTGRIRCGILVWDPQSEEYRPIVVYHPTIRGYCSLHTYGDHHITGQLMSYFQRHKNSSRMKDFTFVSPRVPINGDQVSFHPHDVDQDREIKDILANIIYYRRSSREVEAMGALNIDSDEPEGINIQRFEQLKEHFGPLFRLIALHLYLLRQFPDKYVTLQLLDETQEERHD